VRRKHRFYGSVIGIVALMLVLAAARSASGAVPLPKQPLASGTIASEAGSISAQEAARKSPPPPGAQPARPAQGVRQVCVEPVVNVSQRTGNESESFVVINPTNPNNIVAFSNLASEASIFRGYSTDAGATWTRGTVATGAACCDGQAAFDMFGNLFMVYLGGGQVRLIASTDGGATFTTPTVVSTGGTTDQPSIAVGNGSVWVDWNQGGSMVARGAPVTGLGVWGPFNTQQTIPTAQGSFGGIAVGPGPNGGKVMVVYQSPTSGQGPATIYVNVDADGLGAGGFGPRITVTTTNVGGFDFIPPQNRRSIDAESGLVWDSTGGPFNDRVYMVYTEETVNENGDTEIYLRNSTDDGATWSAPVRVNDDPVGTPIRSQFNPYITLDRTSGVLAIGWHDSRNDNGVPGVGGTNTIPNDDAEYYASFSTDGGATWAPNDRLSGGFSNSNLSGNGIDYGDYVGQDAYGGKFVAVWADNSNCDGTNANGTLSAFDLYMGTMLIPGGGPTPTGTLPTSTPSRTPTSSPTSTASATTTATRTATPTNTTTGVPTSTNTSVPIVTDTAVATDTSTATPSRTSTSTATATVCAVSFSDVPPSQPFYTWIRCLACRGIISGYADGTFHPENNITRGQIAKVVSNSAGLGEDPGPQIFEDVPPTNPFYDWVNRLSRRGHMSGYDCGAAPAGPCVSPLNRPYFLPFNNATRGQLSKIVANAAEFTDPVSGQTYTDVPPSHPFYLWIMRLTNEGVISGYDCGGPGEPCDGQQRPYFRPYNNATRGQASKIVANSFFPECDTPRR
jgi:hypothetical protein